MADIDPRFHELYADAFRSLQSFYDAIRENTGRREVPAERLEELNAINDRLTQIGQLIREATDRRRMGGASRKVSRSKRSKKSRKSRK